MMEAVTRVGMVPPMAGVEKGPFVKELLLLLLLPARCSAHEVQRVEEACGHLRDELRPHGTR